MSLWNKLKVSKKPALGVTSTARASTTPVKPPMPSPSPSAPSPANKPAPGSAPTAASLPTTPVKSPTVSPPPSDPELFELPEGLRTRYKVESKVGKGAFGTALLVTDKASSAKYVAKVMNISQMTPDEKGKIKDEIECLSQCDHVNIIRHIESYADDTTLVLLTEYADGGDLGREIQARKEKNLTFTSTEIACVVAQISLALDHVHAKGMLHRDIKPSNIFFTRRGLVKMGDFGFSKHHNETCSNEVGVILCSTPYYLPPEMWLGESYSKKADAWSVGIVLFEMMMLKRPFTGDSMKQLSESVLEGMIPAIPAGAFDDELVQACSLLLSLDTVDRPELHEVLKLRIFQSAPAEEEKPVTKVKPIDLSVTKTAPGLMRTESMRSPGLTRTESIRAPGLTRMDSICSPRDNSTTSGVAVYVRIRPFAYDEALGERENGSLASAVRVLNSTDISVANEKDKGPVPTFTFDQVLWSVPDWQCTIPASLKLIARQPDVFDIVAAPMIEHLMAGFNTCIMAYGQTGSGKTHTMIGAEGDPGIVPRACDEIFRRIQAQAGNDNVKIAVFVTFHEIYNEQCYDLLTTNQSTKALRVRQDPKTGPYIEGLRTVSVNSSAECWAILGHGLHHRSVAETLCNARSSRSHALFQIILERVEDLSVSVTPRVNPRASVQPYPTLQSKRTSRMSLVDLAGVEKTDVSGVKGERLAEANFINLSLTTLRKCIDALIEKGKGKKVLPPYRESMLTWVLSEDLGGNCRTAMVAAVSPHRSSIEDTISTLRYAMKARGIVRTTRVNEDTSAKIIRELREEVTRCQMELSKSQGVSVLAIPALAVDPETGCVTEWNMGAADLLPDMTDAVLADLLRIPAYADVASAVSPEGAPQWKFSWTLHRGGHRAYMASCIVRMGDAVVCLIQDASPEFTIRHQASLHEQVIDMSPVAILTVSSAGVVELCNTECARLLGVEKKSLCGQDLNSFLGADIFDLRNIGETRILSLHTNKGVVRMSVNLRPLHDTMGIPGPHDAEYMVYFTALSQPLSVFNRSSPRRVSVLAEEVTSPLGTKRTLWRRRCSEAPTTPVDLTPSNDFALTTDPNTRRFEPGSLSVPEIQFVGTKRSISDNPVAYQSALLNAELKKNCELTAENERLLRRLKAAELNMKGRRNYREPTDQELARLESAFCKCVVM